MRLALLTCVAIAIATPAPVFAAFPFSFGGVNDADPTAAVDIDTNSDNIEDMAVTPQGDLLVAGHFEGEAIDFSPHNSTVDVVRSSSLVDGTYRESGFLASYSGVTSQLNWVAYAQSDCAKSADDWEGVWADSQAIYLAGAFCGNTTVYDGNGADVDIRTTDDVADPGATYDDAFVAKFDHAGNLLWIEVFGSAGGSQKAQKIGGDTSGNLYLTGHFSGTVDFDASTATESRTAYGSDDAFVLSLASDRSFRWVKRLGGSSGAAREGGEAIEVAGSGVYVAASVKSDAAGIQLDDNDATLEFDPTTPAADGTLVPGGQWFSVVQRLSASDGSLVWSAPLMGPADEVNTYTYVSDLSIGGDGAVYSTGYFYGSIDLNPSSESTNTIPASAAPDGDGRVQDYDGFVLKLQGDGSFVWGTVIGQGDSTDTSDKIYATADPSPSIFVTGDYANTIDADGRGVGTVAGPGSSTETITSAGDRDVFLTKLTANGALVWARSIGGTEYDTGDGLAGGADDVVYLGGQFRKEADIDPTDAVVTVSTADYAAVGDNTEGLAGRDAFIVRLTESTGEVLPADSDNDGIDDETEASVPPYTDPNNPDSDGDGVKDGNDAFPLDSSRSAALPVPMMPLPVLFLLAISLGWLAVRRCQLR